MPQESKLIVEAYLTRLFFSRITNLIFFITKVQNFFLLRRSYKIVEANFYLTEITKEEFFIETFVWEEEPALAIFYSKKLF
jgi:hypothetical protein